MKSYLNWFRDWFGAMMIFGTIGLFCVVSLADVGIELPINPYKAHTNQDGQGNIVAWHCPGLKPRKKCPPNTQNPAVNQTCKLTEIIDPEDPSAVYRSCDCAD